MFRIAKKKIMLLFLINSWLELNKQHNDEEECTF